jgi:hypothetical protein
MDIPPLYNTQIYPGILVDMESWAIGRVAQRFHRSSLILKIPYDHLGTEETKSLDPQDACNHLAHVRHHKQGHSHVTHWYTHTQHQDHICPLPRSVRASHSQIQQRNALALSYYACTKKQITDQA